MRSEASTAEAIQQAIAQGAITEAYQADPQQVIQALNRLRATEVTSYLQYKQHAYMAVSLFAPGLEDDFEAHATLELQHADVLAQRIQQLGGVPLYSPVDIAAQAASVGVRPEQGPTLRAMIIENLMLERQQVAAYTTLVRELGEGDPTTRGLLLAILADTERHASEWADYLKNTSEVRAWGRQSTATGGNIVLQQRRKNRLPAVREDQGNGIFLLEHGEPHDPCPVEGCAGELRFAQRWGPSYVVCSVQPQQHGRPSSWGEDDAWWRQREQKSPYYGSVEFMAATGKSNEALPTLPQSG